MPGHVSATQIKEALASDEESCKLCWKLLGFPKMAAVDDWRRWARGREYIEGCGQVCAECDLSLKEEQGRVFHQQSG
ncbi:MAG: hypothetical protein Q8R39_00320 [bacterium]|nr:hypothetical protein [bacterium]MDZ4284679.1 hypothetical protein [Patescibacteria group bacterium]